MALLTLQESFSLPLDRANALYAAHLNPELLKIYRALGLAAMDVDSAEGVEIRLAGGRTILDFSAGIGVLGLGHNHPRIIAAERVCHEKMAIDALKVAPLRLQGALAHNLAEMLPGPLEICFFAVSGAEAVEAAMKICEKAQGPRKTKFLTMRGSFHGKTHGALSVTTAGGFQRGFLRGIPKENVVELPYGDIDAAREVIESDEPGRENPFIAVLVEPVTGEGLLEAPTGYLPALVNLCRNAGILTIFDEVKAGMGRTGTFCAFQREDVSPDVVTLSKALGGGKRAIGAMVSTQELYERAYGNRKDCALHTSTFGGLGGTCAVAIEALNVLKDEGLIVRAGQMGYYLREKLEGLREKHAGAVTELRGRGLLQGIRFNFGKSMFERVWDTSKSTLFNTLDSACMAATIRELFEAHGILVHFAPSCPDLLHIMPPLVVEKKHIDAFAAALDAVLARGFASVAASFVKRNLGDLVLSRVPV